MNLQNYKEIIETTKFSNKLSSLQFYYIHYLHYFPLHKCQNLKIKTKQYPCNKLENRF